MYIYLNIIIQCIINVNNFHTAIDNVFKNKHNKNKQCAYFSSPALQCAYFFVVFKGSMCLAMCLFFPSISRVPCL